MQTGNVINLYEVGLRGRPIETIGEGDLAQPYALPLWQRAKTFAKSVVEIARDSRELEKKLLGETFPHYGGF